METNIEIKTAEQHIEKLGNLVMGPDGQADRHPSANQQIAFSALGNEHEIIRLAKRLVDPFLCEVPVLKAQLQCRKEARAFYETLVK